MSLYPPSICVPHNVDILKGPGHSLKQRLRADVSDWVVCHLIGPRITCKRCQVEVRSKGATRFRSDVFGDTGR